MSKLTQIAKRKMKESAATVKEGADDYLFSDRDLMILIGMLSLVNSGVNLPPNTELLSKNGKPIKMTEQKVKSLLHKAIVERISRSMDDIDLMDHDQLMSLIES